MALSSKNRNITNCLFCFKRRIGEEASSTINDTNTIKFICKQLNVDFDIFQNDNSILPLEFPICSSCDEIHVKKIVRIYELLEYVKCQLKTLIDGVIKEVSDSYGQEDTGGDLLNSQDNAKAVTLFRDEIIRAAIVFVKPEPEHEEDQEEENQFDFFQDVIMGDEMEEMESPEEVKVEIPDRPDDKDDADGIDEGGNDCNSDQQDSDGGSDSSGSDSESEAEIHSTASSSSDFHVESHQGSEDEGCQPVWKKLKVGEEGKASMGSNPKNRWPCGLCQNVAFDQAPRLRNHNQKFHKSAKLKYLCSRLSCDKRFSDKNLYKRHITFHDERDRFPDRFHCTECDIVFQTEEGWETHEEQHRTNMRARKICGFCGFESIYPSRIRQHEVEKHPDKLTHPCSKCKEKYSSSSILEVHMKSHAANGPYLCSICQGEDGESATEIVFSTGQSLERHLMRYHISKNRRSKPLRVSTPTVLSCETCGRVFQARRLLQKHKISQHSKGEDKDTCELCPAVCKTYLWMVKHVVDCHESKESTKVLECTKCPKKFATNFMLQRHTKMHRMDKTKPISCEICEARFASDANKAGGLQFHMERSHQGLKPKHQCRGSRCQKSFCIKLSRNYHEREMHPELLIYCCLLCDKMYQEKEFLTTHLTTHYEGDDEEPSSPPFTCEVCRSNFVSRDTLADHLFSHTGERRFKCPHCSKQFMHKLGLDEHVLRAHTGERPHECEICSKKFVCKSNLRGHMNQCHRAKDKKYCCDVCDKIYSSRAGLNGHKSRDHGLGDEKKRWKEICELCGKCVSREFFKTHMQIHEGTVDLKQVCTYCGKKFRTGFELRLHTLIHTGEKPFTCHVCNRGFTQKHSWRKHLEVHKKNGTYIDP